MSEAAKKLEKSHLQTAFYFTALWGRITSNRSSQDVQEIDGFKDREVPPVWWVNFNHQSGAGGARYVQKATCILICLIQQCEDIFWSLQFFFFHGSPAAIVCKIFRNTNEGNYDAFKWGRFFLSPEWPADVASYMFWSAKLIYIYIFFKYQSPWRDGTQSPFLNKGTRKHLGCFWCKFQEEILTKYPKSLKHFEFCPFMFTSQSRGQTHLLFANSQ